MTTKTEAKPEVVIPQGIVNLAAEIKKDLKIGDGGIAEAPKDFYAKHLPEGLTLELVKRVHDHDSDFFSASGLALGELGLKHLKSHKTVEAVELDYTAIKNKHSLTFRREKQVPDGLGKGGMRTKHGDLSGSVKVYSAGNVGSFKKVREHLASEGSKVWG